MLSRRQLKKVPLPWPYKCLALGSKEIKLELAIRSRFVSMYGERSSLSAHERKEWGEFLHSRGVHWEVVFTRMPSCDCWDCVEHSLGCRKAFKCIPKDPDGHIAVLGYFVPVRLAEKILVLGCLP